MLQNEYKTLKKCLLSTTGILIDFVGSNLQRLCVTHCEKVKANLKIRTKLFFRMSENSISISEESFPSDLENLVHLSTTPLQSIDNTLSTHSNKVSSIFVWLSFGLQ